MKFNTWQQIHDSYTPLQLRTDKTAVPFLDFLRAEEKVANSGGRGTIYASSSGHVPGQLQTYAYARSLMRSAPVEAERQANIRLARTKMLTVAGVAMCFLVESEGIESVVDKYRSTGKSEIIEEQLDQLIRTLDDDMNGDNKIDFRLLPRQNAADRTPLGYTILLDDGGTTSGFLDATSASETIAPISTPEVQNYKELWATAGSLALDRDASLHHLRQMM